MSTTVAETAMDAKRATPLSTEIPPGMRRLLVAAWAFAVREKAMAEQVRLLRLERVRAEWVQA